MGKIGGTRGTVPHIILTPGEVYTAWVFQPCLREIPGRPLVSRGSKFAKKGFFPHRAGGKIVRGRVPRVGRKEERSLDCN